MTDAPPPSELEQKIETRMIELLDGATQPKDLTAALKVAIAYYAVKKKVADGDGWGAALGGGKDD